MSKIPAKINPLELRLSRSLTELTLENSDDISQIYTPDLTAIAPDAAKPGDRRTTSNGLTYRMKQGATDASLLASWEQDKTIPRLYPNEAARLARTGFTPVLGETIGIVGTGDRYEAKLDSADDIEIGRKLVTFGIRQPRIGVDGPVHIQTRDSNDRAPKVWVEGGGAYWVVSSEPERSRIIISPHPTVDFTGEFSLSNTASLPVWVDSTGVNVAASNFEQAAGGGEINVFMDRPGAVLSVMFRGLSSWPVGIDACSSMTRLDLASSGMTGACGYLGDAASLVELDVSGNPGFTIDDNCTIDNLPALKVIV